MSLPLHHLIRAAALALAAAAACSVGTGGLGGDGGPDRAASTATCPAGLTDQASWPANSTVTACARPCGPDGIGIQACGQIDRSTCQKQNGCLCLESPCVQCADCAYMTLSDCYIPTNAATPPACEDEVKKGEACAPACSRRLCLRKDGKTACVCNVEGVYACGDWSGSGWK
jgi:hypothetical protein